MLVTFIIAVTKYLKIEAICGRRVLFLAYDLRKDKVRPAREGMEQEAAGHFGSIVRKQREAQPQSSPRVTCFLDRGSTS